MRKLECPSEEMIQEWAVGALADEDADRVVDHLDICPSCEEKSEIAGLLRLDEATSAAQSETGFAAEDECRKFIGSIQKQPQSTHKGVLSPDTPKQLSGKRVRDYELLETLGQGAMGTVFKARHVRLNKLVAVKLMSSKYEGGKDAVARFQREMQAIGQLQHHNIVQALDAGEADGIPFLVMEYVVGADIATLANRGETLSVPDACEIARQAAIGLRYAHQRGLVHRDIKPSNLMLTTGEGNRCQVKILDLGLALIEGIEDQQELTAAGQLMGTLEYMSPEQAVNTHLVDQRSDLYSLGATLFRLLTGDVPFKRAEFRTAANRLHALTQLTAPSIADGRPDLPPELAQLVDEMLARNPALRPDMDEVIGRLGQFANQHRLSRLLWDAGQTQLHHRPDDEDSIRETKRLDGQTVLFAPDTASITQTAPELHIPSRPGTRRGWLAGAAIAAAVPLALWWRGPSLKVVPDSGEPDSVDASRAATPAPKPTQVLELWKYIDPERDRELGDRCRIKGDRVIFPVTVDDVAADRTWIPVTALGSYQLDVSILERRAGRIEILLPLAGRTAALKFWSTGIVSLEAGDSVPVAKRAPLARGSVTDWPHDLAHRPPWHIDVRLSDDELSASLVLKAGTEQVLKWEGPTTEWEQIPERTATFGLGHAATTATFAAPTLTVPEGEAILLRHDEYARRTAAAKRIIEDQGQIELTDRTYLLNASEVPDVPFRVRSISFSPDQGAPANHIEEIMLFDELFSLFFGSAISDAHLGRLSELPLLDSLAMIRPSITKSGLKSLQGFPRLRYFDVSQAFPGDLGPLDLTAFQSLESFNCHDTPITNLDFVCGVPALERISIQTSVLFDEGTVLPEMPPKLNIITLNGVQITEVGLLRLAEIPTLQQLNVTSGPLTQAKLEELKPRLGQYEMEIAESRYGPTLKLVRKEKVSAAAN